MPVPTILQDKEGNLDLAAILGIVAFAVFLMLSYHAYIIGTNPFDPMSWGTGAGALAAGHGAGKLMSNRGDYGAS